MGQVDKCVYLHNIIFKLFNYKKFFCFKSSKHFNYQFKRLLKRNLKYSPYNVNYAYLQNVCCIMSTNILMCFYVVFKILT